MKGPKPPARPQQRHSRARCIFIVTSNAVQEVGKSYLASAIGQGACRRGLRVLCRRMPRLFEELALAKADGTYARTLGRLTQADALVLDDLGLGTVKEPQRNDLLEVLEDRYGKSSTVVTSQLPIAKWHEWIADATAADAILDRLVHNAYKIAGLHRIAVQVYPESAFKCRRTDVQVRPEYARGLSPTKLPRGGLTATTRIEFVSFTSGCCQQGCRRGRRCNHAV